ncbi:hypothetical protein HDU78_008247 [Chytriomyces hyalinus]|nr:hypothetical protein HDU78_008247 [Chytriomyces hyalinus]
MANYGNTRFSIRENHLGIVTSASAIHFESANVKIEAKKIAAPTEAADLTEGNSDENMNSDRQHQTANTGEIHFQFRNAPFLLATTACNQINVYDCDYCAEGALDLVSQFQSDFSYTACVWANVEHDLLLCVGDSKGRVSVFSFTRSCELARWDLHAGGQVSNLQVFAKRDGYPFLLVVSQTEHVSLLNVDSDTRYSILFQSPASAACLSEHGDRLIYSDEGSIAVHAISESLNSGSQSTKLTTRHSTAIEHMKLMDNDTLVSLSSDGMISVIHLPTDSLLSTMNIARKIDTAIFDIELILRETLSVLGPEKLHASIYIPWALSTGSFSLFKQ